MLAFGRLWRVDSGTLCCNTKVVQLFRASPSSSGLLASFKECLRCSLLFKIASLKCGFFLPGIKKWQDILGRTADLFTPQKSNSWLTCVAPICELHLRDVKFLYNNIIYLKTSIELPYPKGHILKLSADFFPWRSLSKLTLGRTRTPTHHRCIEELHFSSNWALLW